MCILTLYLTNSECPLAPITAFTKCGGGLEYKKKVLVCFFLSRIKSPFKCYPPWPSTTIEKKPNSRITITSSSSSRGRKKNITKKCNLML